MQISNDVIQVVFDNPFWVVLYMIVLYNFLSFS
jgi:hypothetical protein